MEKCIGQHDQNQTMGILRCLVETLEPQGDSAELVIVEGLCHFADIVF